jgi:chemotaxis protein histidine kinase CheA
MALSLKVTYNNDTRQVSCPSAELYQALASRFDLHSPHSIKLWFDKNEVDVDQILALAEELDARKPGKRLKLDMTSDDLSTDSSTSSSEDEVLGRAALKAAKQAAKAAVKAEKEAAKQAAKAAKQAAKEAAKAAKKSAKNALKDQSNLSDVESCAAMEKAEAKVDEADEETPLGQAPVDPKDKQQANKDKQQAKKVAQEAKKQAKSLKQAAKAERQAKKAEMKAANATEDNADKKDAALVLKGKLVDWSANDGQQCELIVLPSSRICVHLPDHKGNLRVNNKLQLQSNGARGPWAQFTLQPADESPSFGKFRLESSAHAGHFLGMSDGGIQVCDIELAGMWSFYPEGSTSTTPYLFEANVERALPTGREVYVQLQEAINMIAERTKLPIHLGDAPDDETELLSMLNELHELLPAGIKKPALKHFGLRVFEMPEPQLPEEWDMLLEDLQEMGFSSDEENRKAVKAANGDLKQAIKTLVKGSTE